MVDKKNIMVAVDRDVEVLEQNGINIPLRI